MPATLFLEEDGQESGNKSFTPHGSLDKAVCLFLPRDSYLALNWKRNSLWHPVPPQCSPCSPPASSASGSWKEVEAIGADTEPQKRRRQPAQAPQQPLCGGQGDDKKNNFMTKKKKGSFLFRKGRQLRGPEEWSTKTCKWSHKVCTLGVWAYFLLSILAVDSSMLLNMAGGFVVPVYCSNMWIHQNSSILLLNECCFRFGAVMNILLETSYCVSLTETMVCMSARYRSRTSGSQGQTAFPNWLSQSACPLTYRKVLVTTHACQSLMFVHLILILAFLR